MSSMYIYQHTFHTLSTGHISAALTITVFQLSQTDTNSTRLQYYGKRDLSLTKVILP